MGTSLPRTDLPGKVTGTATYAMDVRLPGMMFAAVRMSPRLGGEMQGFDAAAGLAMEGVSEIVDLGNGIAAIANNTWSAIQAVEAVDVTWGPAPYPETSDGMFVVLENAFDEKPNSVPLEQGDVAAALAGDGVITAEYRVPYLAHATMEPMNTTALFTGDALELWSGIKRLLWRGIRRLRPLASAKKP